MNESDECADLVLVVIRSDSFQLSAQFHHFLDLVDAYFAAKNYHEIMRRRFASWTEVIDSDFSAV